MDLVSYSHLLTSMFGYEAIMFQVHQIPALKDNYFWLIQPSSQSAHAYIVDPGDAEPVDNYLQRNNLQLKGILLTHHHHDHIDGALSLSERHQLPIHGPKSNRIPQVTHFLKEGDQLSLGGLTATVLALPGHTLDHIAYFIEPIDGAPMIFSGDTIFAAGCGRLFDGTAELLHASLQKVAALPDNTLIYAAHEYTLSNINFALDVEPENKDLLARHIIETRKRESGLSTLPTYLALEKQTNPFLRSHLRNVRTYIQQKVTQPLNSDADFFASLRLIKDSF